jgi:hypothetical protein
LLYIEDTTYIEREYQGKYIFVKDNLLISTEKNAKIDAKGEIMEQNLGLIIAIVTSAVGILGTILGVVIPLHLQTLNTLKAIQEEMKDFHGRLCAIEERNKTKIIG